MLLYPRGLKTLPRRECTFRTPYHGFLWGIFSSPLNTTEPCVYQCGQCITGNGWTKIPPPPTMKLNPDPGDSPVHHLLAQPQLQPAQCAPAAIAHLGAALQRLAGGATTTGQPQLRGHLAKCPTVQQGTAADRVGGPGLQGQRQQLQQGVQNV